MNMKTNIQNEKRYQTGIDTSIFRNMSAFVTAKYSEKQRNIYGESDWYKSVDTDKIEKQKRIAEEGRALFSTLRK